MPSPGGSLQPAMRRRAQDKTPELSPDTSPKRIAWTTRRRLWSPPPRPKNQMSSSPSARSSASSMIPRHALAAPLRSVVIQTPHEPDSPRSRRAHHHGCFPPRLPSKSVPQHDTDVPANTRRRHPLQKPSPPDVPDPPSASSVVDRRRPPPTRHGSRGSCSTASSIMKTARTRPSKAAVPGRRLAHQPEVGDAGARMTRSGRLSRPPDRLGLGGGCSDVRRFKALDDRLHSLHP